MMVGYKAKPMGVNNKQKGQNYNLKFLPTNYTLIYSYTFLSIVFSSFGWAKSQSVLYSFFLFFFEKRAKDVLYSFNN